MTIAPHAPTIDTDDLILRGYAEPDFEAFAAFAASDRSKFVGGPQTRWESWRSFMAGIGHWMLRGYGMWMVEHRSSGQVAGRVGMINNDGWDEPELGWHIYDGFEGRGYAHQACLAARTYACENFGLDAVISYIDPINTRSLALAKRLGAVFEREGELLAKPCHIYRHPKLGGL